jgi:Fe-S cluster biogenesis protein NfuA
MSITLEKVKEAIEDVRPYLTADGGDVEIVEITDKNIVKVKLLGTCSHCPMATLTLRAGIERALMLKIPEIKRVEAINL